MKNNMISLISNHKHFRNTKRGQKNSCFYYVLHLCSTSYSIACLSCFCNNPTWEQGNYLELQTNDCKVS